MNYFAFRTNHYVAEQIKFEILLARYVIIVLTKDHAKRRYVLFRNNCYL